MNFDYEYGYPTIQRESFIKDAVAKSHEVYEEEYQGKTRKLPVIEVGIELLVYRLENIRTLTAQKEYLATHPDVKKDFFKSDPSSLGPQKVQHGLLKAIVNKDELIKAFSVDKRTNSIRKQKYPLIISDDGIVVNGNCRLCAWRELYYSNKETYKNFQMIRVAVLPNHDPKGMYDLEVALQLGEPEKQEYIWHAIAADAKSKANNDVDWKDIVRHSGRSETELKLLIAEYEYAEQYLKKSGHPDEWSRVDKQDQAFKQIVNSRKNINHPGEKLLFEEIAQSMLDNPAQGDRLYAQIPKVAKNLDKVADKLKTSFHIQLDGVPDENLNLLLGGDANQIDEIDTKIAAAIHEADDSKLVVNTVISAIDDIDELDKEKKKKEFVFEQCKKAATEMNNAVMSLNDNMTKEGIDKQLETIEGAVMVIKDWINDATRN